MRENRSLRDRRMAAILLTVLLAGVPALAQPVAAAPAQSPLQVEWITNDPTCDGADVAERALQLVTSGVVPRPLTARVKVTRDQNEWLVRIETQIADRERAGQREFRAESCDHLEKAVSLLLAMTLESGDLDAPLPAPPPPPAEPTPPPAPSEPAPPPAAATGRAPQDQPPSAEPTRSSMPIGWFLRLDGRAGVGLKPGVALGTGLAGGVRLGPLDLGIAGAYWPVTKEPVPGAEGAYTLIQRASAGIRACWNLNLGGSFALAPCVTPEAVVFITGTEGIAGPDDGPKAPIPSITGSLELRYALAGEHLSVLLGAAVSAEQRQPFQLNPENIDGTADTEAQPVTVYETKGVGPRLEIGLDARF
jgi:hypothetical protein